MNLNIPNRTAFEFKNFLKKMFGQSFIEQLVEVNNNTLRYRMENFKQLRDGRFTFNGVEFLNSREYCLLFNNVCPNITENHNRCRMDLPTFLEGLNFEDIHCKKFMIVGENPSSRIPLKNFAYLLGSLIRNEEDYNLMKKIVYIWRNDKKRGEILIKNNFPNTKYDVLKGTFISWHKWFSLFKNIERNKNNIFQSLYITDLSHCVYLFDKRKKENKDKYINTIITCVKNHFLMELYFINPEVVIFQGFYLIDKLLKKFKEKLEYDLIDLNYETINLETGKVYLGNLTLNFLPKKQVFPFITTAHTKEYPKKNEYYRLGSRYWKRYAPKEFKKLTNT